MNYSPYLKGSLASFFQSYFSKSGTIPSPKAPALIILPSHSTPFTPEVPLDSFISYLSKTLHSILPKEHLEALTAASKASAFKKALLQFLPTLPIVTFSDLTKAPATFCASLLVPAHLTHGVGRYFTDAMSRWLIPGKFLPVYSSQSLNFCFEKAKHHHFFIHQIICPIEDIHEAALIQENAPALAEEIRLNISAVKHSRTILASNRLPPEYKRALLEQGISTLLNRPSLETDSNVFDQMHHFLLKLAGEEKEATIKKSFSMMLDHKPFLFDRDIFSEIRHFILLLRDRFTAIHTSRHITKTISLLYFFRKTLLRKLLDVPNERHVTFKVYKAHFTYPLDKKNVLSLIIGINILQENELLEKRHLLSAIENILPTATLVENSFVIDRRPAEKIRLFYLEIEKQDSASFKLKETLALKKRLPRELRGRIENVLHPILLSRNEEEIFRNIVLLTQELKYVHDIPQAYISFDAQVGHNLSFTVILLRLLHKDSQPLKETLNLAETPLHFLEIETKRVGALRKKYPKEANVFRIELDKTPFLRRDFSLDLFKARLVVSEELTRLLGEFRDYNGGILSKQNEALTALKAIHKDNHKSNDFLLENFFYSVTPAISRTILYTSLLSTLYRLLLRALEKEFIHSKYSIETESDNEYLLIMIAAPHHHFKAPIEKALSTFNIPQFDLATTYNDANEIACLGIILRSSEERQNHHLLQTLHGTMHHTIPSVKNTTAN